ncbi:MAG: helix-turn-helix domain-containing protein [Bryobacterales bacterium]|nr:helix-turn-helix domain-containing protein [Bryobacterales bacterium]
MAHLGDRLRQQRLAMGVSLQHISGKTRVGLRYFEALEAGDFKQLPGAIFARSFVRQYAEIVGIDPSTLEAELQQMFPSEEVFPNLESQSSTLRATLQNDTLLAANGPLWQRLPLTALSLTAALAISSLLYIGWQRMVVLNETKEPVAAKQPAPPPVSKPSSAAPGVMADPPRAATSVVPAAATVVDPAPPPPVSTELRAPVVAGGVVMAVRIKASQESWVSVSANGTSMLAVLMKPNEERTLQGVENARIILGNAGGIEIETDGRSIGPIGPQGAVRLVMLTPSAQPRILTYIPQETPTPADSSSQPAAQTPPAASTQLD